MTSAKELIFASLAAFALTFAAAIGTNVAMAAGSSDDTPAAQQVDPTWQQAMNAIEAKRYEAAIPLLQKSIAKNQSNADAWNYLAFSNRKLGRFEKAHEYYAKALSLNPDHKGAHEYLGELYLQENNIAKAEEMLAKLDKLCFFSCQEYRTLKKSVAEWKARNGKAS